MLNVTYKLSKLMTAIQAVPHVLSFRRYDETLLIASNVLKDEAQAVCSVALTHLEDASKALNEPIVTYELLEGLVLYYVGTRVFLEVEDIGDQFTSVWVYQTENDKLCILTPQAYRNEGQLDWRCGSEMEGDENRAVAKIIATRQALSYPSFLTETWCSFEGNPVLMMLTEFSCLENNVRFGIGEAVRDEKMSSNFSKEPHFTDLSTQLPNSFYFLSTFDYQHETEDTVAILAMLYIQQWERTLNAFGNRYVRMLFKTLEQYVRTITNQNAVLFLYNQSTLGLYCEVDREGGAETICEAIIDYFKTPWYYDDFVFFSNVKIGVSFFPSHTKSPLDLISYANMALKNLRKVASSDFIFFDHEMKNQISENIVLFGEIRSAMDNSEFVMYYQPQVSLATGRIVGAEALVRWIHPERGLISPGVFLPAISKIGLDYLMDQYVVNAVSQDQARLKHLGFGDVPISFNLSASSLNTYNIYDDISDTIMMNDADSSKMIIEITETAEVFMNPIINEQLLSLKSIGLSISIDDFGTGYSSLSYLASLPVDAVKIDKVFPDGYPNDKGKLFLIDKIVEIASSFHLDLTIEGIETEAQVMYFKKHLPDAIVDKIKIQGYYYYKPMSFEALVKHLKK